MVFETKDRAVNLNDAYKLSAKASRVESVLAKARRSTERRNLSDFLGDEDFDARMLRRRAVTSPIIPVVISTLDIAKDAKDLLLETKEESRFLENCQSGLPEFLCGIIDKIDRREARSRFAELTSFDEDDSATSLARNAIQAGFQD